MAYLLHAHTGLQPLWRLPVASLPIAAVAVVLILLLRNPSMRFFNRALAAGLAPVLFSINQAFAPPGPHPAPGVFLAVGFTSASAMLGYAVYRMYWEKAYVDDLTGLPNRRTLNERLAKLGRRYTVAMLDIDHFKRLNDTHGHAAGDHVLRFLAAHLQRAFGANAYRYGGEEFCVLFENVDKRMAAKMLDAFRRYIASREFVVRRADEVRKQTSQRDRGELEDGVLPRLRITLSAGLAYRDIPDEKPEDIIELADKTLYAAKQQGRNRVLYYGPLE
jgi:diguanylate cyclase (GGDEF)-like protein